MVFENDFLKYFQKFFKKVLTNNSVRVIVNTQSNKVLTSSKM